MRIPYHLVSCLFPKHTARVFTGDQRPSMMARGEMQRSSTLIDPATLARPTSQFMSPSGEGLVRRNSSSIKPLLSFENDKIPQSAPMPGRPMDSRSVFGVDKLWEREMVKLRQMEAQEKVEEEERKRREEDEERRKEEKKSKKKRKDKGARQAQSLLQPSGALVTPKEMGTKISVEPPVLPDIQRATRRPPPPPVDDDDDGEESDDDEPVVSPHQVPDPAWHAGSSDEEDKGPRRTTGVGPRYPNRSRSGRRPVGEDSDEDLPLAASLNKALRQVSNPQPPQHGDLDEDEDEEKPLSSLLHKAKAKQKSPSLLDINFDGLSTKEILIKNTDEDEDDDRPLGLRASKIPLSFDNGIADEDDDDRPLGLHPDQQRRTQYGMLAQQQQQQQMMMQAQLHNSMFFNPSMMGSGFFAPPMATPIMNPMNPMIMMQVPVPAPSPPPVHDAVKFGRVDKWRRDVAVEGER